MEEFKRYYPPNAFRMCIDNAEIDLEGRIYSPLSEDVISFRGIGEALLKMDSLFDQAGYPQAFQEKRSFEEKKHPEGGYGGIPRTGAAAQRITESRGVLFTLDVLVDSRRNTTWQGSVTSPDSSVKLGFSGEMELLKALQAAASS